MLPEESQYDHVPGVDMGIENIATDSDNRIFERDKPILLV